MRRFTVTAHGPVPAAPEGPSGSTRDTRVRRRTCRRRSNSSAKASRNACTCGACSEEGVLSATPLAHHARPCGVDKAAGQLSRNPPRECAVDTTKEDAHGQVGRAEYGV